MAAPSDHASVWLLDEAVLPLEDWCVVDFTGRHAERFLAGQLTSDIRALGPGRGQWSALLDASGRLRAWAVLARPAPGRFVAAVPAACVDAFVEDLSSRIIADDVALRTTPGRPWIGVGPRVLSESRETVRISAFGGPAVFGWGVDSVPDDADRRDPEWWNRRAILSATPWGPAAPEPGVLVTTTQLVDLAIARDKGCYLGQETVNKVLSGRGAARAPVWLRCDGPVPVPDGSELRDAGDRPVGRVIGRAVWGERTHLLVAAVRGVRVEGLEVALAGTAAVVATTAPLSAGVQDVVDALCTRSSRLFAQGAEDRAEAMLRRAIAIDPGAADAYEALGVLCGRQRRFEEALELMDRLLEADPDSVMAHSNKSVYHNQLGDVEEAEREAALAAQARLRSQAERRQAEVRAREEAVEARRALQAREAMFRQVLELDPDDPLANFALGEMLLDADDPTQARGHLERTLAASPDHSAAHLVLGRCLEDLGKTEGAIEIYRAGVRIASARGDLQPANRMQARLAVLT